MCFSKLQILLNYFVIFLFGFPLLFFFLIIVLNRPNSRAGVKTFEVTVERMTFGCLVVTTKLSGAFAGEQRNDAFIIVQLDNDVVVGTTIEGLTIVSDCYSFERLVYRLNMTELSRKLYMSRQAPNVLIV